MSYRCFRGFLGRLRRLLGLLDAPCSTDLVSQLHVLRIGLGQVAALEPHPLRQGLDTSSLGVAVHDGMADPISNRLVPFELPFQDLDLLPAPLQLLVLALCRRQRRDGGIRLGLGRIFLA